MPDTENIYDLLQEGLLKGNSIKAWLLALVVLVASFFLLRVLKEVLSHRLKVLAKKTHNSFDDMLVELIAKTHNLFFVFVSIYLGSIFLVLPASLNSVIASIAITALIVQFGIWGNTAILRWGKNHVAKKSEEDKASAITTVSALAFAAKIVLWSILALIILDNLGIDVTALVAGLGVGGIAIALAVQNVLGDIFSSLSIVIDKPFVIGDFIIVGDYMGCVERIGLKTSHIRSLSGEQIIFSNTDLLQSRVRNYKRMSERRIVFALGVTYDTPLDKLKLIPEMIKEVIEGQKLARFDRSHFKEYGDFSLNYETVYYVNSPDYNSYMDTQQAINFEIHQRFDAKAIEFAYPTQTLYVNKEPAVSTNDQVI